MGYDEKNLFREESAMQPSMETRCVHGLDHAFEENTHGLTMPIYQTAAWRHTQAAVW